ncbi:MAG TPA: hypothetical protein VGI67_02745 [Thermoleophilaceae bacterium]|jgi:hypothetical protein
MTDEERRDEAAEEQIEDLDAPAEQLEDVAGGGKLCGPKSCGNPSMICIGPTCHASGVACTNLSHKVEVYEV